MGLAQEANALKPWTMALSLRINKPCCESMNTTVENVKFVAAVVVPCRDATHPLSVWTIHLGPAHESYTLALIIVVVYCALVDV